MGWIAGAVAIGGALINAYGAKKKASADAKAAKEQGQMSSEDRQKEFQRQAWLNEQARKWQLEDRAYKEDAVGNFRDWRSKGGPAEPVATTAGNLTQFDPNEIGQFSGGGIGAPKTAEEALNQSAGNAPRTSSSVPSVTMNDDRRRRIMHPAIGQNSVQRSA